MTTATAPLDRLVRARQCRLRSAERARRAELTATRYPEGSPLHAEQMRLAATERATAAEWGAEVSALEAADPGRRRRTCAAPGACELRARDGSPFCAEHDD